MAQQTAVEWFAEQAEKILIDLKKNNSIFQFELCLHGLNELEQQAKQREQEQMINLTQTLISTPSHISRDTATLLVTNFMNKQQ